MTKARDLSKLADGTEFTAADNSKLDAIEASATADQTNAEIRAAVEAATDSNVFTDADHSKLNGVAAGATADQTNAEIRAAVEAASDSNVFSDADHSKLNAVEASADVTDTANVTAAGALMDSELTNLAAVKAINQSLVTTASPTFAGLNTTSELITKGGISIDSGSSTGPEFSRERDQNLKIKGQSGGDVGITGYNAADAWAFQLYGGVGSYGFLEDNWADWDIRKYTNGKLYLNGNNTYYLQPETTSKLNNVQVGGIDFGTSGASAETLDSYEEGTYSPTITAINGNSATFTVGQASYTKIGRMVHVMLYISSIDLSAITSGSYIILGNFPFTAESYGSFNFGYKTGGYTNSSTDLVGGYVQSGAAYAYFTNSNGTEVQQGGSYALNRFMASITYPTSQ
jgi:hypothetical protein